MVTPSALTRASGATCQWVAPARSGANWPQSSPPHTHTHPGGAGKCGSGRKERSGLGVHGGAPLSDPVFFAFVRPLFSAGGREGGRPCEAGGKMEGNCKVWPDSL